MARKQLEELLSEVSALADRLTDNGDILTSSEISDLLREVGYEPEQLRARLNSETRAIALRLRKAGRPVPRYILDVLERTASLNQLAERNPSAAQDRMRRWIRGVKSLVESGEATCGEAAAIAHAYRKTGELSPKDSQVLEEIQDDLRRRLRGLADEDDGGTHGQ